MPRADNGFSRLDSGTPIQGALRESLSGVETSQGSAGTRRVERIQPSTSRHQRLSIPAFTPLCSTQCGAFTDRHTRAFPVRPNQAPLQRVGP